MTDLEFLQAVRAKIDTPEKWTQGTFGRAADGRALDVHSDDLKIDSHLLSTAAKVCIIGAAYTVANGAEPHMRLSNLLGFEFAWYLTDWNDEANRTHDEVLALIDEAIAKAS